MPLEGASFLLITSVFGDINAFLGVCHPSE